MNEAVRNPVTGELVSKRDDMSKTVYTKARIRDQIKIARYNRLVEEGEHLEYFSRIIEEIGAGNYSALLTISYEHGLSLGVINKVLERLAEKVYPFDRMPVACELETLRMTLGASAEELKLIPLGGKREIDDSSVRKLYFMLAGSVNAGKTMEFIREYKLDRMYSYIWERGLHKFLDNRYRILKGPPEEKKTPAKIIEELSLPAIFDESVLISRFTGENERPDVEGSDIRDQLAMENSLRAEALAKINVVFRLVQQDEVDYEKLERAMSDARMELEISIIEKAGIDALTDYIRSQAIVGAREVALRYEFVCPSVSNEDMVEAGRLISKSYFSQSQNTKKGQFFLRAEVLNNLRPFVANGQCHRLPGNYLLACVRTADGEEHYLICKQNSKLEQDTFCLRLLANFYFFEAPQKAVYHLIRYYLELQSGGIRTIQAIRKVLFASPIVLSLAVLVGILYYIVFGVAGEGLIIGGFIAFIGSLIAAKNGYEEEINPAVHQKIPSYISRKNGKVTATTSSLDFSSADTGQVDDIDGDGDSGEDSPVDTPQIDGHPVVQK